MPRVVEHDEVGGSGERKQRPERDLQPTLEPGNGADEWVHVRAGRNRAHGRRPTLWIGLHNPSTVE